jgi:hypothetical protein
MHAPRASCLDPGDKLASDDKRTLRLLLLKLRWMGLDADAGQASGVLLQLIAAEHSQLDLTEKQLRQACADAKKAAQQQANGSWPS